MKKSDLRRNARCQRGVIQFLMLSVVCFVAPYLLSAQTSTCLPAANTPQAQMITLTNQWRSSQGLTMVASDPRLEAAALAHATDMATTGVLSHTGSDGSHFGERTVAAGYPAGSVPAELIARSNSDASQTFDLFINDSPHRTELSNPSLTQLGVALVMSGSVGWWSIEFGTSAQGPSCDAFLNQPPRANAGSDQSGHLGTLFLLDASASSDPDDNYPLTYSWKVGFAPPGSTAVVSNPTTVNPSFKPDLPGTYTLQLIVTDSLGAASAAATVNISTQNVAPIAEAGRDQSVIVLNSKVHLDGSASYDVDGDPIAFSWSFVSRPPGSSATLSNPFTARPTFVADTQGEYEAELVVHDPWSSSLADMVHISFSNVAPVADAGGNQAVLVGSPANLNGISSSDANSDTLTYRWSMVSKPIGSIASLNRTNTVQTYFVPDKSGTYVIALVVNDGIVSSSPDNITVTATYSRSQATDLLTRAIDATNSFGKTVFKNPNMQNTLTNKIAVIIKMTDHGQVEEATAKLRDDVIAKMDGCFTAGNPDNNDWIITCPSQKLVYPLVFGALDILGYLH